MFNRVGATVLFVEDLDKVVAFYRDVIGLEVVFTDATSAAFKMVDQDFAVVSVDSGANMTSPEAVSLHGPSSHRVMLCVTLDDVDTVYKTLTDKGVTFIKPPIDQHWGWRTAYFADPEGNLWELRQSIKEGN